ncbi:unnamed protein product [Ilex paraguariensis]|uniref:Uncharacterized protein n=1 Tax=Ilex paraguariensis TaxID=185542 RepID=A0ABC8R6H4_9AQUA
MEGSLVGSMWEATTREKKCKAKYDPKPMLGGACGEAGGNGRNRHALGVGGDVGGNSELGDAPISVGNGEGPYERRSLRSLARRGCPSLREPLGGANFRNELGNASLHDKSSGGARRLGEQLSGARRLLGMLGNGALDASNVDGEPRGEGDILGFTKWGERDVFSLGKVTLLAL